MVEPVSHMTKQTRTKLHSFDSVTSPLSTQCGDCGLSWHRKCRRAIRFFQKRRISVCQPRTKHVLLFWQYMSSPHNLHDRLTKEHVRNFVLLLSKRLNRPLHDLNDRHPATSKPAFCIGTLPKYPMGRWNRIASAERLGLPLLSEHAMPSTRRTYKSNLWGKTVTAAPLKASCSYEYRLWHEAAESSRHQPASRGRADRGKDKLSHCTEAEHRASMNASHQRQNSSIQHARPIKNKSTREAAKSSAEDKGWMCLSGSKRRHHMTST